MREMKGSGIPWIGKVPSNWLVEPIFSDFVEVTRKNKFGREKKALKFTYGEIVPKANFDADNDNYVADTILKYTIVEPGTIMLNGLNLNYDFISQRIGLVKQKGVITSAYTAFKPINMQKISSKYSTYLFKAYDNCKAFHNMGGGVRKILNFKELSKQPFIHPPIGEQHRIADYLDTKCARIDSIRKNVEAEIEALKQYKQSVITEAVTKGLDKNVEMKDSGIPWIGKIPKDWTNKRIKYLLLARDGGSWGTDPTAYNKGTICMRIADFDFDNGEFAKKPVESLTRRVYTKRQIQKLQLQKNDICIEKSGGGEKTPVGRAVIFNKSYLALFANFMDRLRFDSSKVNPVFAEYWFRAWYSCKGSPYYINQTTGIQNINLTLMMSKEKMFFPSVHEQQRITDFLDSKCAKIDSIIQKKQELLANLDTYKKSLIYEYVTGKKEVPAV